MEAARHLRVADNGELPVDAPSYGDVLQRLHTAEEMAIGQEATIKSQAAMIGRLKRQLEEADIAEHPQRDDIFALIDRWQERCHHRKAKRSKDRIDLVKARMKDGYSVEQIALAIDGLASAPFVVNAQRRATGKPSQRYDQLKHALKGGEDLERFANLGHLARKEGRIIWPEYDADNDKCPGEDATSRGRTPGGTPDAS